MVIYVRQRNVKNKEDIINTSKYFISKPTLYKGKWHTLFNNSNPIYIEIGMGKGKFIIENAKKYPNINFIGIEKFDSILALALKKIDVDLSNLYMIRLDANNILDVFDKEITRIYLNFSDPWPKKRHEKRRLTSDRFLNKYEKIFKEKCHIIQKTDNRKLFEFSLISYVNYGYKIKEISLDLNKDEKENVQTEYEEKFTNLGYPIYMVEVDKNLHKN